MSQDGQEAIKFIDFQIHEELNAENRRHYLTILKIKRGWTIKTLAEEFGRQRFGAAYDRSMVSRALNAKAYPNLSIELEEFMKQNNGPKLYGELKLD